MEVGQESRNWSTLIFHHVRESVVTLGSSYFSNDRLTIQMGKQMKQGDMTATALVFGGENQNICG